MSEKIFKTERVPKAYSKDEINIFYNAVEQNIREIRSVPEELHEEIAYRLLWLGQLKHIKLNSEELNMFTGLDQEKLVDGLIKDRLCNIVARNIDIFSKVDISQITEKLFVNGGGKYIPEYLEKFQGIDHQALVDRLFQIGGRDELQAISENADKFKGVDLQDMAHRILSNGYISTCYLVENLDKFKGIDKSEVADELLKMDTRDSISKLAHKLKSFGNVIFDKKAADRFLRDDHAQEVVENLEKFIDIDYQNLADHLIATGRSDLLLRNLKNFKGLSQKTAEFLIRDSVNGRSVAKYIESFALDEQGLTDIVNLLFSIRNGYNLDVSEVLENLDKIHIDQKDVLNRLFLLGFEYLVVQNVDKFTSISHQEIANRLLKDENATFIMNANLNNFKDLSIEGFRKVPWVRTFLSKFDVIIPNGSARLTVEQAFEMLLNSVEGRERILQVLKRNSFLAEAFLSNRYGIKLVLKYPELDKTSHNNISLLYDIKNNCGDTEQNTPEFRDLVQERLKTYKNNGRVVESLEEKGVDVDAWLSYQEQTIFHLGKEDETSFAKRMHLPITRLNESQKKYAKGYRETLKPYSQKLLVIMISEETEALHGNIEAMRAELETAKRSLEEERNKPEKDEKKIADLQKKIGGIPNGVVALQKRIDSPKQVSAWDRILGDIARIERFMKAVSISADALSKQEEIIANLVGKSGVEDRKKLIEAKSKNAELEKKFREDLSDLEQNIAKFEEQQDGLLRSLVGEDEKKKIVTAFRELVLEDRDHMNSDIGTLQNLLEDDQKENASLSGTPMSIGVWNRCPDEDLYLGNYTDCCIRIDSVHMGAESTIADYLTDLGIHVIKVRDEKKNIPVVAAWSFIGKNVKTGEVALVVDNIEANTDYSIPFTSQLHEKLKAYFEALVKSIGIKKIVQGQSNNDLTLFEMDNDYVKLGGYNRKGGYFLEGERASEDEEENDQEDEEQDEDQEENDTYEDIGADERANQTENKRLKTKMMIMKT